MTPWRVKQSNLGKLREAARMAVDHPVMLAIDIDRLMTLSLAPWQPRRKVEAFEGLYQVLGVFRADPGEVSEDVFARLLAEAEGTGAPMPDPGGTRGGRFKAPGNP